MIEALVIGFACAVIMSAVDGWSRCNRFDEREAQWWRDHD